MTLTEVLAKVPAMAELVDPTNGERFLVTDVDATEAEGDYILDGDEIIRMKPDGFRGPVEFRIARPMKQQILDAIDAGFAAGGVDEWESPEFEQARELTKQAGCVWDFMGWRDTADCIRYHSKLGGVDLA